MSGSGVVIKPGIHGGLLWLLVGLVGVYNPVRGSSADEVG